MSSEAQTVTQRVALGTSIVTEFRSVATFRGCHAERFSPPPSERELRTRGWIPA